jgi:hypothetical protein
MGMMPFAGITWQALHYLEGLRSAGFDVFYIEDTSDWTFDPTAYTMSSDCSYAVNYNSEVMNRFGFGESWAYRSIIDNQIYGLSARAFDELFSTSDILINLCGMTESRSEHRRVGVRIYLETDPVLPQIKIATGDSMWSAWLDNHTHFFTFGENIGAEKCVIPTGHYHYQPTRQPIVIDWWTSSERNQDYSATKCPTGCFTTIANWKQSDKDITWNGETYNWSKHHEFLKVLDLPLKTEQPFELALSSLNDDDLRMIHDFGWQMADTYSLSLQVDRYRDYILGSAGEFTVAKDQNIRLQSGWFSDRSACYLAAGKPVITQDTGFQRFLPIGEGLFAFKTMEDILSALETIQRNPKRATDAAREIAMEYFSAEKVISSMIDRLGSRA